ncbi:MAG: CPBP family intramembrane glutamic endopeptidase [Prevotella sp.]|jgi:membrane protease YdiL (CAAX protease family)
MNKIVRGLLDIVLFIVVFFLIQYFITLGVNAIAAWNNGEVWQEISTRLIHSNFNMSGKLLVVTSVLSSVLTMTVFIYAKWAEVSRVWLASHPWLTLVWVVIMALGTILPSEWLQEQINVTMPENTVRLFEAIMGEPTGYLAIGILAPLAEELVFRGAILRALLKLFDSKLHWIPILLSALLFGAMHGNYPQFIHASLIGLILGWMYYRTDSIVPGVVFHWVNNTVAYVMFNLMPQMADGKLIDLFHGDSRTMWLGLGFSLCLLIPSFFQLNLRLKHN